MQELEYELDQTRRPCREYLVERRRTDIAIRPTEVRAV